jgi:8-oxo-dGTP pyrophosphatase MutT (NUDIX family)
MSSTEELYRIADELRAIACVGLHLTGDRHDREYYERLLAASARLIGAMENRASEEILTGFKDNLLHMSPLAGAEAAVVRDGELLLIRRRDDALWALPGGYTEVGETLAESACRELKEEAGISGRAARLLGIFDSRLWRSQTKAQLYHVIFQVEPDGSSPTPGPEVLDAAFFGEEDLPTLSPGHHLRVPFVFKQLRGDAPVPYFDAAETR